MSENDELIVYRWLVENEREQEEVNNLVEVLTHLAPRPLWIVNSGKPRGEVYDREVVVCLSEKQAKVELRRMQEGIEDWEQEYWLDGPAIRNTTSWQEVGIWWNGFAEVIPPLA